VGIDFDSLSHLRAKFPFFRYFTVRSASTLALSFPDSHHPDQMHKLENAAVSHNSERTDLKFALLILLFIHNGKCYAAFRCHLYE
jgi:hypothetical protein